MSEDVPEKNGSNEKPLGRVWTLEAWTIHTTAMREADQRLQDERDRHHREIAEKDKQITEERDRRYAEVGIEKEKALKIKETGDAEAMRLARESQTYKETQADTAARTTQDFVSGQLGAKGQASEYRQQSNSNTGIIVAIIIAGVMAFLTVITIVISIVVSLSGTGGS